jgi:hypothetical protein
MKEPKMFPQTSAHPHYLHLTCPALPQHLYDELEVHRLKAPCSVLDDLRVSVVNTQRVGVVAAFGIKDTRQEPFTPIGGRRGRPGHHLHYTLYTPLGRGTDRVNILSSYDVLLKDEASGRHAEVQQVARRPLESLPIAQREAELIRDAHLAAPRPTVGVSS